MAARDAAPSPSPAPFDTEAAANGDGEGTLDHRPIFFAVSTCFFSLFLYYSFFARFTTLIYVRYGLSASEIGTIGLCGILAGIPSSSFWGQVADRSGRRKRVLSFCLLLSCALQSLLSLAPRIEDHEYRFAFICAISTLFVGTRGNDYGQLRGIAMRALARCRRPDAYGKLRLWGALSWGIAHPLLGWMLDALHGEVWPLFVGNAIAALLVIFCINCLLRSEWTDEGAAAARSLPTGAGAGSPARGSPGGSAPLREVMAILCAQPWMVAWLLCGAAQSMGMQHVFNFLFVFMIRRFHSTELVMGWSVLITVLFEVPIFAFSETIVPRLGPTVLVCIAMASFFVRVLGYTLVPNSLALLALEPLHGVTYSCFTLATVHFVNDKVPMRLVSSAQGFMASVGSMGSALGALLGGLVMDLPHGGVLLFRTDAVIMATVLALFVMTQRRARLRQPGMSRDCAAAEGGAAGGPRALEQLLPPQEREPAPG